MKIVRSPLNDGMWLIYRDLVSTRAEFERLLAFVSRERVGMIVSEGEEDALSLELGPMNDDQEQAFLHEFGVWRQLDGRAKSRRGAPPRI